MASIYVRESSAGKSISAYVIMRGTRKIGTVLASYGSGGGVLVNVFQDDKAAKASEAAAVKAGEKVKPAKYGNALMFQYARASGYGYDKFTAALSGLWIDGHVMTDHCSRLDAPKPPRGHKLFPRDSKPPRGYSFANYTDGSATWHDGTRRHPSIPENESGYMDCYRIDGLKYLEAIGYTVIQVI